MLLLLLLFAVLYGVFVYEMLHASLSSGCIPPHILGMGVGGNLVLENSVNLKN